MWQCKESLEHIFATYTEAQWSKCVEFEIKAENEYVQRINLNEPFVSTIRKTHRESSNEECLSCERDMDWLSLYNNIFLILYWKQK